MNFYPHLVNAYQISRKATVFLVSNSPWIFLLLITIFIWSIWSESFFDLAKTTFTQSQISPESVSALLVQGKQIGTWLLFFFPLLFIIWRVSQPITLRLFSESTDILDGFWRIFLFDIIKIIIIFIAYKLSVFALQNNDFLSLLFTLIPTLLSFSFLRYFQTLYFTSPHKHLLSAIFRTWVKHFPDIVFLHFIDVLVFVITFCMTGIILAAFIYLPFLLFLLISAGILFILGRLFVIWKGLWAYSTLSLVTQS